MKHISRSRSILKGKAGAELPQSSVFKIGVSLRTQTTLYMKNQVQSSDEVSKFCISFHQKLL